MEIIGWLAMALTLSSFLFEDQKNLRIVNLTGCLIWILYGSLLSQTPIILTNAAIGAIHIIWFKRNWKNI